jgi:hypothetical protein
VVKQKPGREPQQQGTSKHITATRGSLATRGTNAAL